MNKNVPKLRFKEFHGELRQYKFKEVVKLQRGSSPRPIIKYITSDEDGVNWIKIGDVSEGEQVIRSTKEKITKEGAEKSRYVEVGDLILSNSMSYGRPYIMGIDGYIHDGWFVLKDYQNNFNREYLCQFLISPAIQKQYKRLAAGGVVDNISSELVNSVEVKLPSLQEQEKIADFFTIIDRLIEEQEGKVRDLKIYKKGMMQKIFKQEIRFKDDNGLDYPEWEEKKLGNIADIGTGSNDLQDKDEKGIYPFFVRSKTIERINKYTFDGEAILIPGDGSIGQIYHYINGKFAYHQRVYKISDFVNGTLGKYIYFYMNRFFLKEALKNSVKATVDSLRLPTLTGMLIKLPCLEEQTKIANFLTNIDNLIEEEQKNLDDLREMKKGLLQQMFV